MSAPRSEIQFSFFIIWLQKGTNAPAFFKYVRVMARLQEVTHKECWLECSQGLSTRKKRKKNKHHYSGVSFINSKQITPR